MSLPSLITLLLVIFLTIPCEAGLGVYRKTQSTKRSDDHTGFETFYFDQTLDHFIYTPGSYRKFRQKYVVQSTYWAGGKSHAPILAYLGDEASLDVQLGPNGAVGFLSDNGPHFKALLIHMEHRYYGESMPFGSAEESLKNATTLAYLNAPQALADYAAIILHVKEVYAAQLSPVIVIGGSYGGMLAAWFKLKYPHIALGALASSAPLLYFEDTLPKHGYFYIVSNVFKETSESCHDKIRESWDEIDRIAAQPSGLSYLSDKFRLCNSLNGTSELKKLLEYIYAVVVQYNDNRKQVATLCEAINTIPTNAENDLLDQIFAGVVAYMGNDSCYYTSPPTNDRLAWGWQVCTEMVVAIGHNKEDTMFQTEPFNMSSFTEDCESKYHVPPSPHWATAYFGNKDAKLILRRFGKNIILSNGLSDPYSVGGILEDISDTVVAITTREGSHCRDLHLNSKEDPDWLVVQKKREIKIIDSWISTSEPSLLSSFKPITALSLLLFGFWVFV